MGRSELWKFVKDCNLRNLLHGKRIRSSTIDRIFQRVASGGRTIHGGARRDERLDVLGFVEVLLRVAAIKGRNSGSTLDAAVDTMIENEILPNACRTETESFRRALLSPQTSTSLVATI